MIQEEEKKLSQDQDSYQTLKDQLQGDRSRSSRHPKKSTVTQLQQEIAELQSKYTQLCSKLETPSE